MLGGISGYRPQQNFALGGYGSAKGEESEGSRISGMPGQEEDNAGKVGDEVKKPGRRSSPEDCETCKERKYQDGSDECDVSFQTPQHIDPNAAGAAVRAHEHEHVVNAYEKAAENNGKVLSVGVSIHTAVCPECGRVYVSGGLTTSKIAFSNEDHKKNPYDEQKKAFGQMLNTGMRADYTT